jgi:hypothetical protein
VSKQVWTSTAILAAAKVEVDEGGQATARMAIQYRQRAKQYGVNIRRRQVAALGEWKESGQRIGSSHVVER